MSAVNEMRLLVIIVFLALTLFAIPVHGEPYVSVRDQKLQAELDRRKEVARKKALANESSRQTAKEPPVRLQSRIGGYNSRENPNTHSSNYSRKRTKHQVVVLNNPPESNSRITDSRSTQPQSLQSQFMNADWGTPSYSGRSIRPQRHVSLLGSLITGLVNYQNSQLQSSPPNTSFNYMYSTTPIYTPQYNRRSRLMRIGGHTYGNIGNASVHTYKIGDHTYGKVGTTPVHNYQIGNMTYIQNGNRTIMCNKIGNITHCN